MVSVMFKSLGASKKKATGRLPETRVRRQEVGARSDYLFATKAVYHVSRAWHGIHQLPRQFDPDAPALVSVLSQYDRTGPSTNLVLSKLTGYNQKMKTDIHPDTSATLCEFMRKTLNTLNEMSANIKTTLTAIEPPRSNFMDLVMTMPRKETKMPDMTWEDRPNGNSVWSSDRLFCTVYLKKGTTGTWKWAATHCLAGDHIGTATYSKSSFSTQRKAKEAVEDLMSFVGNRTKVETPKAEPTADDKGVLLKLARTGARPPIPFDGLL